MKAKEYLSQIVYLDARIEALEEKIRPLRERAMNTAVNMSPDRVQAGSAGDKIAEAVASYSDLEIELESLKRRREDISSVLKLIPAYQSAVLHKVYVDDLKIKEAARELRRSYSWAAKVHTQALASVQRILNKREKTEK